MPTHDPTLEVEALLVELLERLSQGEGGALEELCRAHPALESELRERVDALREMNLLPTDSGANAFPERLGDFRLLRRLGGGGMGVVYEAFDESTSRTVALKLIRPEHLYFPRAKERFRRETQAVSRLSHPGIVALHAVGESNGTPYLAMELVDGVTAQQALEQFHGVTPEGLSGRDLRAAAMAHARSSVESADAEVPELFAGSWVDACVRVAAQVAQALAHAHENGILHRDIKPSNIAITPQGRVVLLDFGLAGLESEGRMTITGATLGSVLYMAPEQVAGRSDQIDARTDVYALGATLYELLALQPPYSGADAEQTRAAILEGAPSSIRARNREVSRELELVCFKAIERERARRYASTAEFARDLDAVLRGRAVSARPPGLGYRAWRWVKRHPTRSIAAAAIAAVALVGPAGLYVGELRQKQALARALAAESAALELARSEGARADERASEAEATAGFLTNLFGAADPYFSGRRDVRAAEVLSAGLARIDVELAGQPRLQARLLERIGESFTNLERYDEALPPLERALRMRLELDGPEALDTAVTRVLLGSALRLSNRPGYVDHLRKALAVLEREAVAPLVTARCEALLVLSLIDKRELAEASQRVDALAARVAEHEELPRVQRWNLLTMLASAQSRLGRYPQAEATARAALAIDETADAQVQEHPFRAAALDTLGMALRFQGRTEEALAVLGELAPMAERLYGRNNPISAEHRINYARALHDVGRVEDAAQLCRAVMADLAGRVPANNKAALGAVRALAFALQSLGRFEEAANELESAREAMLAAGGEQDPAAALTSVSLAETHLGLGEFERAADAAREAFERLPAAHGPSTLGLAAFATWRAGRDASEAQATAERALESAPEDVAIEARLTLALCALARGDRERARAELEKLASLATPPENLRWTYGLALVELGLLDLEDAREGACDRIGRGASLVSRSLHRSHVERARLRERLLPLASQCAEFARRIEQL